jgi:two-component system, NarL family, nitrate/nitrite response regulator NarL
MTFPTVTETDTEVRVVIVDDHGLLAQSLTFALRAEGLPVERCEEISTEAITDAVHRARPDLVLLDLDLGSELGSSLSLIPLLAEQDTKVVMLTGVTDRVRLAQCVQAGAVGIIAKSEPFETLIDGVKQALDAGTLLSPNEREEHLSELRRHGMFERQRLELFAQLTRREEQVLAALMDGTTAEQIAAEWVVAMSTVRSQIRNLLVKLGVNSQLSAVVLAQKAGWRREGE